MNFYLTNTKVSGFDCKYWIRKGLVESSRELATEALQNLRGNDLNLLTNLTNLRSRTKNTESLKKIHLIHFKSDKPDKFVTRVTPSTLVT